MWQTVSRMLQALGGRWAECCGRLGCGGLDVVGARGAGLKTVRNQVALHAIAWETTRARRRAVWQTVGDWRTAVWNPKVPGALRPRPASAWARWAGCRRRLGVWWAGSCRCLGYGGPDASSAWERSARRRHSHLRGRVACAFGSARAKKWRMFAF